MKRKHRQDRVLIDSQSPQLREVLTLLAQLPETERIALLKYLIHQPTDQAILSEVLEAVAHRLANEAIGLTTNKVSLTASSRNREADRKLALN